MPATTLNLSTATPADRVAALDAQIRDLDAQIRQATAPADEDGWADARPRSVNRIDAQARALLDGTPVAPTPDVRELRERRAVLARARQIADAQAARAEADPLAARLDVAHREIESFTGRAFKTVRALAQLAPAARALADEIERIRADRNGIFYRLNQAGDIAPIAVTIDGRSENWLGYVLDLALRCQSVIDEIDGKRG